MKQYLFVYPIEEYIGFYTNVSGNNDEKDVDYIQEIIDTRYRKGDYKVNWLLFQDEEGKPERERVYDQIDIKPEDNVLAADVTFHDLIHDERYANPEHVLDQIPESEKLVLGGFHTDDCVDRIAEYAHRSGIDTFVDEDTTELFFIRTNLTDIPLIREDWSLEALGISENLQDAAKEIREGKPWFRSD